MKRILLIVLPVLLIFIAILFYLRGCNEPQLALPWELWEEIRRDSRQSPDFLPGQYARAMREGSPREAFEFVRDKITTVPAQHTPGFRWGIQGMLRTGQGTPFEKALLLSSLLEAKGIKNEIHWGRENFTEADSSRFSLASLSFQSQLNAAELSSLLTKEGVALWSEARLLTPDSLQSSWRDSLIQYLHSIDRARYANRYATGTAYPVYAFIDSTWVYLNPSYRNARWGEHYVDGNPDIYRFSRQNLKDPVTIRLKASYDDRSYSPFTLAEASWPLDSVIGRDIRFGFKVLGPPDVILNASPKDFETFVASIELLDSVDQEGHRITGDILTTHGNVVPLGAGKNWLDKDPGLEENDPSEAFSIKLSPPKMADYPTVMVEAEVLDSAGNPVMGLAGEAFEFKVNNETVTHRMVINQVTPPRVLFLYDDSRSMPFPYVTRKKTIEIFTAIAEACQAVNPDTEFAVSPFGDKESKIHELSRWSASIPEMVSYILQTKSGESNNWSALLGAMNVDEANIVIVLSDADGSETGSEYTDLKFSESPPTFVLGVPGDKTIPGEFEKMAQKSKGTHYTMTDQLPAAAKAISRQVGETKNNRYLIELEMEAMDIPEMDLSMAVPAADLIESLKNIDVPPPSSRPFPGKNSITGLYMEIEYDGIIYTKKLAGVPLGNDAQSYPVTRELIKACENALWGEYIVHIEGSSVLPSVAMNQITSHYLDIRNWVEVFNETDPDAFFEKIKGIRWWPDFHGKWPVSMYSGEPGYSQQGLNAWLHSTYPDAEGIVYQQLDRIPSSHLSVPSQNPRSIARHQMEQSLDAIQTGRLNFGLSTSSGENFQHRSLNGFGGLFMAGDLSPWQEATTSLLVGRSRDLVADPESEIAFVKSFRGASLTAMSYPGTMARRQTSLIFDREKPLVESPFLWRKLMGMEMDTWDDLEGNKLAYIQAGTVAMKNLGEGRSPEELMAMVKSHLASFIIRETAYPELYFTGAEPSWISLYNLARNNLMSLTVDAEPQQ